MDQTRDREIRPRSTGAYDETQRQKTDTLLRDLGADDILIETVTLRIDDDEVQGIVKKLRTFAQDNSAIVLGALSALIAGGAVAAGRAVAKSRKKSAAAKSRPAAAKTASTKSSTKRSSTKRSSSKRTLIEPHPGDKRYIRRDAKGRIKESVDVGRSLSADARHQSKTRSKSGSGDKGDR